MKFSSGILGLTLSSVVAFASANAADLSAPLGGGYKDFSPTETWAGFYAGVNGGWAWGTEVDLNGTLCELQRNGECAPALTGSESASATRDGGFGGGQIGYNIQRDRLVFGLEADFQGAGVTGGASVNSSISSASFGAASGIAKAESDLDWFGTVRGRLGLTFPDTAGLIYITGGFAYGGLEHKLMGSTFLGPELPATTLVGSESASRDQVETGWVLGAGYERYITPALSLKVEYQYIDLGSERLTIASSGTYLGVPLNLTTNSTFTDSFSTVRAGLNYHLGAVYEPLK